MQDYHDPALRKLYKPTAERNAALEAERLSEEVREEIARFSMECAATQLAPKRWLLDTGAPHDLTSIKQCREKNYSETEKGECELFAHGSRRRDTYQLGGAHRDYCW